MTSRGTVQKRTKMGKLRLTCEEGVYSLNTPYGTLQIVGTFIQNFLKMVELPVKAVNEKNPLTTIFNGFAQREPEFEVRLYVINGEATTIVAASTKIIDHNSLGKIQRALHARYDLVEMVLGRVTSHLFVFSDELFRAFEGDGGLFAMGLHVAVPHDGSKVGEVNRALRRLLGGNISIVKNRKTSSKFNYDGVTLQSVAEELLRHIKFAIADQDESQGSYLKARLQSLAQTKASLQELLSASNQIDNRTGDWLLAEPLELDTILDHYGLASPTERSANWCKSAATPIWLLDVFNLLSEIAARHFSRNEHNKVVIAEAAGKILTRTGDLEDVAPRIKWKKFDRKNQSKLY